MIKALLRILAADYVAEAKKQHSSSSEAAKFEFVFATEAPGGNFTGQMQVGEEVSIPTLAVLPLYLAPINEAKYQTNLSVTFRDRVTVLSPVRAGWVKVGYRSGEFWMSARPLASKVLTYEDGSAITGFQKLANCPGPRLVNLRSRGNVQRLGQNIQVTKNRQGVQRIDFDRTTKVSPANSGKTYISCETFSLNNSVAAIRLVEVQVIKARNGQTTYLPAEDIGGFVLMNNSVFEGASIDPETWSVK